MILNKNVIRFSEKKQQSLEMQTTEITQYRKQRFGSDATLAPRRRHVNISCVPRSLSHAQEKLHVFLPGNKLFAEFSLVIRADGERRDEGAIRNDGLHNAHARDGLYHLRIGRELVRTLPAPQLRTLLLGQLQQAVPVTAVNVTCHTNGWSQRVHATQRVIRIASALVWNWYNCYCENSGP